MRLEDVREGMRIIGTWEVGISGGFARTMRIGTVVKPPTPGLAQGESTGLIHWHFASDFPDLVDTVGALTTSAWAAVEEWFDPHDRSSVERWLAR